MYSLLARCFVINVVVLSFWSIDINFSYTNIGQKMLYWDIYIYMFYDVWILKTKRYSMGKMWTGGTFCRVCLYCLNACLCVCLAFHILCLCTWANIINASFCLSCELVILFHRVQPTRCSVSQFIYFCKTLYVFQTIFPSIITRSKLRITASGICQTNTWRCMCSFELVMMDGKTVWNA